MESPRVRGPESQCAKDGDVVDCKGVLIPGFSMPAEVYTGGANGNVDKEWGSILKRARGGNVTEKDA